MQDIVCDLAHRFLQNVAEVTTDPIVGRGEEIHSLLVRLQAITLAEALSRLVVRIVHGNAEPSLMTHHGEARHIRRSVAYVDHMAEWYGAQISIHVVIHILGVLKHPLIDTEEELRLGRVGKHAFREIDTALLILAQFTTEHLTHERTYH